MTFVTLIFLAKEKGGGNIFTSVTLLHTATFELQLALKLPNFPSLFQPADKALKCSPDFSHFLPQKGVRRGDFCFYTLACFPSIMGEEMGSQNPPLKKMGQNENRFTQYLLFMGFLLLMPRISSRSADVIFWACPLNILNTGCFCPQKHHFWGSEPILIVSNGWPNPIL